MKNRMRPMKVGQVRYTAAQLDEVDLDFPVGRPIYPPTQGVGGKARQHVARTRDGWIVFGEGNTRATVIEANQKAAIKIATRIAKNKKSSVVVHSEDGKILETRSDSWHGRLAVA